MSLSQIPPLSFANTQNLFLALLQNPATFPLILPLVPIAIPAMILLQQLQTSQQTQPGFLTTLRLDGSSPTSFNVGSQTTLQGVGWPATSVGAGTFNITNPDGSSGGTVTLTSKGGLVPFNIILQAGTVLKVSLTTDFPSGTLLTVYGM